MNDNRIVALVALSMGIAGRSANSQSLPMRGAVRVADCVGPATSLPDSLARRLPPRTGRMQPDDHWADLATSVPGGFAGTFYDSKHTPILMLVRPESASVAKAALAGKIGFAVEFVTVRKARWDFAQLVDWFNFLLPRLTDQVTADKDEAINRIRFGVTSVEARDRVVRTLRGLHLPCDLVVVDLSGSIVGR
jgi:hypothetical protein